MDLRRTPARIALQERISALRKRDGPVYGRTTCGSVPPMSVNRGDGI